MRLVSAAIKYRPLDSKYFMIVTGKRHSDIWEWLFNNKILYVKDSIIQGFLLILTSLLTAMKQKRLQ